MKIRYWMSILAFSLAATGAFTAIAQKRQPQPTPIPNTTRDIKPKAVEKRLALVIGNANYRFAPKLRNPGNDARDMAATLGKLGFTVIAGYDLALDQMEAKVSQFGDQLKAQKGVGLVYYAGHGIQFGGANYLIPADADIKSEQETKYKGLNLGLILDTMDTAKNGFNLIILDACRNNPFGRSWSRDANSSGGLAQTNAPTGTFIAYATAPGSVAADGAGRNGTFTAELLKQMQVPNLKVEEVFKNVRQNVTVQTKNKQTPWDSSSLVGDFYFSENGGPASTVSQVTKTDPANVSSVTKTESNRAIPSYASIVTNYESNLIDDVIRDATVFLGRDPNNPRINGLLGLSLLSKAQVTNAMPYLERAIALGDEISLQIFRLKKQALINDELKPGLISLKKSSMAIRIGNDTFSGNYSQLKEVKFVETQSKDYALFLSGDFLFIEQDGQKAKQKIEKNKDLILLAPLAVVQQVAVSGVTRTIAFCKGCETWTKELVRLINRCRTGEISVTSESVDTGISDSMQNVENGRRVMLPSSDFYQFQSERFELSIPANWRNLQSADPTFAPENASVLNGITHGLMVLIFKPASTNLNSAAKEHINSIIAANSYLRQIELRSLMLDGRPAVVTALMGVSPVTNKQENVNIASLLLKDKRILSFILVCPVEELPDYTETLQKIVTSIRIKE